LWRPCPPSGEEINILPLRREDADRLGYDNTDVWRNLLKACRNDIAAAMKIPPRDFRWCAAFHNEVIILYFGNGGDTNDFYNGRYPRRIHKNGGYVLISDHCRHKASEFAGILIF